MSTYYEFRCEKCKENGGFFSRQAWGWGNFDVIDSFKFIAFHTANCGQEYIRVVSEHDNEYNDKKASRAKFLQDTKNIFPLSNDWGFMRTTQENFKEKWVDKEIEDAVEEEGDTNE